MSSILLALCGDIERCLYPSRLLGDPPSCVSRPDFHICFKRRCAAVLDLRRRKQTLHIYSITICLRIPLLVITSSFASVGFHFFYNNFYHSYLTFQGNLSDKPSLLLDAPLNLLSDHLFHLKECKCTDPILLRTRERQG